MGNIIYKYYKLTVLVLMLLGIWPYCTWRIQSVQRVFYGTALISTLVFQLTTFISVNYTFNLFLKNLAPICIATGSILKYISLLFQFRDFKTILDRIIEDWDILRATEEIRIIENSAILGKSHTKFFSLFIYPAAAFFMISLYTPDLLDVIIPLNESRPHNFPIMFYIFVDEQKYFYILAFLTSGATLLVVLTFIATENTCILCLQHACALFEIVSYRIRRAFVEPQLLVFVAEADSEMYKALTGAVNMHNRAIEFMKILRSSFEPAYFMLLSVGVVSLSVNMFRLSQAFLALEEYEELCITAFIVFGHFGYIFYLNYMIQGVLDSSSAVYDHACDTIWYDAPIHVQKILQLLIMKSSKLLSFDMYGFYKPSIEGFSLFTRISLSYFMMLHSFQ